jgi:hypothetical protein
VLAGCFADPVTFVATPLTKDARGAIQEGKGVSGSGRPGDAEVTLKVGSESVTVEATESAPDKSTFSVTFPDGTTRELQVETGKSGELFVDGQKIGVRVWNGGG